MKYSKLVPPNSFIGKYLEYMSYVETAESYDFWCALWAIGTGVGREVFVNRPNSPVFLNWYIILAAESGTTRKSTAVSSIAKLVEQHHSIIKGKTSPENLELYLHDKSKETGTASGTFAVGELVTILGKEGYMSNMPGLLTDLYECQEYRTSPGTIAMGKLEQRNVYVTFLSASTPAWLVTAINPSVIEGGFTSRVIFVVDESRKRNIAWPKERDKSLWETLTTTFTAQLSEAKSVGGITISTGGLKKFTNWYNTRATHTDPFMASFEAREDDHLLRVAACLAINDKTYELQSTHIGLASKIIANVKRGANSLFGGDITYQSKMVTAVSRIREILIDAGTDGIKHSELQHKIQRKLDATDLRMLMDVMHECNMIQMFKVKKATFYRATQTINKFNVSSEILSKLNLG